MGRGKGWGQVPHIADGLVLSLGCLDALVAPSPCVHWFTVYCRAVPAATIQADYEWGASYLHSPLWSGLRDTCQAECYLTLLLYMHSWRYGQPVTAHLSQTLHLPDSHLPPCVLVGGSQPTGTGQPFLCDSCSGWEPVCLPGLEQVGELSSADLGQRKMVIQRTVLLWGRRKILMFLGQLQNPRGSSCPCHQEMCILNNAQASPS